MNDIQRLVPDPVLVLGALCAKPADQTHARSEIRPVQLIHAGQLTPIAFFDAWGEFGVSALAWPVDRPHVFYITTGNDLHKLDLQTQTLTTFDVPDLVDVHEITIIDGILWLANTARNEIVAFDVARDVVVERRNLLALADPVSEDRPQSDGSYVERFHCNQVFKGFDGDLYMLVHHVSGKQFVRRSASQLLKKQGNGGVINLTTGAKYQQHLQAPHSVRLVGDVYWVFDSGQAHVNVYDRQWRQIDRFASEGWGRGADLAPDGRRFYVGISPVRKRYLGIIRGGKEGGSWLQVFDAPHRQALGSLPLDVIEQVNNVYVLSAEQVALVQRLATAAPIAV